MRYTWGMGILNDRVWSKVALSNILAAVFRMRSPRVIRHRRIKWQR
jgi:hypothetical protein